MPLMTFPKHRKKLCCVRTASAFTDIKVTIYFQSLSPCLAISTMTQLWPISLLIRIYLWRAAPWWLSKKQQAQQKPSLCTYPSSQVASLGQAQPTGSSCWRQQKSGQCQELTFIIVFLLGLQLNKRPECGYSLWMMVSNAWFLLFWNVAFSLGNLHLLSACFQQDKQIVINCRKLHSITQFCLPAHTAPKSTAVKKPQCGYHLSAAPATSQCCLFNWKEIQRDSAHWMTTPDFCTGNVHVTNVGLGEFRVPFQWQYGCIP